MGRHVRMYFVTHATSYDNERGIASGHRDVELSPVGRAQARALPDVLKGRPRRVITVRHAQIP